MTLTLSIQFAENTVTIVDEITDWDPEVLAEQSSGYVVFEYVISSILACIIVALSNHLRPSLQVLLCNLIL